MKTRKAFSAITAMALAVLMAVSAFSSPAKAADVKNATITKTLTKDANAYAPNTSFTFAIVPGSASAGTSTTPTIYAGVAGGASFASGAETVSFAPAASDAGKTSLSNTTDISLDASKFTKPGIYRYEVTETAGSYDGVTYSTEKLYFDVYVNSDNQIYAYTLLDAADPSSKKATVTNAYDTSDLTVSKKVAGNQGDKNKEFDITITVSGQNGEQYPVYKNGSLIATINTGSSVTVKLKDSESVIVYGLSAADTYTVDEADYSADGYVTTGEVTSATAMGSADKSVEITNTKDAAAPTGIVLNFAPYVIMLLIAAAFAVLFFSRRRKED